MRKGSLADSVTTAIVVDILSGRAGDGAVLPPEPRLSERFGVSRTVIREAMARVAHMGLIRIRQGAGTIVLNRSHWNELDPELLRIRTDSGLVGDLVSDLLGVRRMVEVEVAGNAALRRSDPDLSRLASLLDSMQATVDDPIAYSDGDIAFHDALIAANGNELLRQLMVPVNQIRRIGSVITASQDARVVAGSMAGHQRIYDAIAAGDADEARTAMSSHIAQFERDISLALTAASPLDLVSLAPGSASSSPELISSGQTV